MKTTNVQRSFDEVERYYYLMMDGVALAGQLLEELGKDVEKYKTAKELQNFFIKNEIKIIYNN